ncbi:putative transcriptional regulator [Frankia sp. AiPs1]|uniref:helix-turn-helix transcriptional regulator n=1 Tax=Frankia sp. AiPa1 TaxID=573492 RepID=UPI00202B9E70|nr:WYL domain-containing protein [Frankia sp. AiPa1]MCL9761357.1 WYL domain-containing protein [Frankia sp. AiPa1]
MPHPDRLTAIVEELRLAGPAGRTAASLAARLDVSVRTIRRDLLTLQSAGVPVGGISGPGGGYVLAQHATVPPVTFTQGQAGAAAVALAGSSPLTRDGAAALEKLLDSLPPTLQQQVAERAAGSTAGAVAVASPPAVARTALTATIEEALRAGQILAIDYQDAAGSRTVGRRIEPTLLALTAGQWYLLAWCLERQGPRWFRWDRISRAINTGHPVEERDLSAFFTAPPPGARRLRHRPAPGGTGGPANSRAGMASPAGPGSR